LDDFVNVDEFSQAVAVADRQGDELGVVKGGA
jgi:hypothetical protein